MGFELGTFCIQDRNYKRYTNYEVLLKLFLQRWFFFLHSCLCEV